MGSRLILRFAQGPRRKGLGRKANSPPYRGPLAEALSPGLSRRGPAPLGLGQVTDSPIRPRPRA